MSKPNAMVIGPMKAGTTWLYSYLVSRGDVCLPEGVKETFFFDRRFNKGQSWYLAHFKHFDSTRHALSMEVAPSYFHCPQAPGRIREMLGIIPLVVTLRNPVQRSWSHYLHMLRYGFTRAPLREAVQQYPEIIDASCYATQLEKWWQVFGQEKLFVLFQEDLAADMQGFAERVCIPLGLSFKSVPEANLKRANEAAVSPSSTLAATGSQAADFFRSHRLYFIVNFAKRLGLKQFFFGRPGSSPPPEMSDEDKKWLSDILFPEVEKLEKALGLQLDAWKHL